jgi:hypothetical protein
MKDIDVAPAVDFSTLEQVFIIIGAPDPERTQLEQKAAGGN